MKEYCKKEESNYARDQQKYSSDWAYNQLCLFDTNNSRKESAALTQPGRERAYEQYGFPSITFLEGKRIKEERKIGKKKDVTYTAQLKGKVSDEIRN